MRIDQWPFHHRNQYVVCIMQGLFVCYSNFLGDACDKIILGWGGRIEVEFHQQDGAENWRDGLVALPGDSPRVFILLAQHPLPGYGPLCIWS